MIIKTELFKTGLLSMLILLVSFFKLYAQEAISIFGRVYADPQNGPGYFEPLSNVLNDGMSMHWQSHRPQSRLRFGVSVIAARSFIPEKYKSFEASYTSLENGQMLAVNAPTVFGENEALIVTEANGYSHVFPGGFDYNFITIAVPQLTVEGFLNSAASLRFITFDIDDEVGNFTTFGLSVEHHFAPYLELESTILSASAGYETIEAGDIMDARHSFFQLTGGGYGEVFHYYGSLGIQLFSQSVRYEDPFKGFAVQEIDIPASNRFLLKLGAGFQWSVLSAGLEISPLAPLSVGVQVGVKI
jgi:hypothetical protein